jgi:hypothetical protein
MAYDLIAILTDGAEITLERLAQLLREEFAADPGIVVKLEVYPLTASQTVSVQLGDWSFRLTYDDAPHVRVEAEEIADAYTGSRLDRSLIAGCRRRISMTADDDPGMNHFNDFCFLMQRLGEQTGAILFDPNDQEFFAS